jgi:hypothetical protein
MAVRAAVCGFASVRQCASVCVNAACDSVRQCEAVCGSAYASVRTVRTVRGAVCGSVLGSDVGQCGSACLFGSAAVCGSARGGSVRQCVAVHAAVCGSALIISVCMAVRAAVCGIARGGGVRRCGSVLECAGVCGSVSGSVRVAVSPGNCPANQM